MQERVENHLKSLLIKHFDPQKADSIFTVEGEVGFSKVIHDVQILTGKVSSPFSSLPVFALSDPRLAGADDRTHHLEGSVL